MDEVPALRVGRIYTGLARVRPIPESTQHAAIVARVHEIWRAAFDYDSQSSAKALLSVLAWHNPWEHWEQVYHPAYVGDRYQGAGCRSCGPGMYPCITVRTIGDALGVSPDA